MKSLIALLLMVNSVTGIARQKVTVHRFVAFENSRS